MMFVEPRDGNVETPDSGVSETCGSETQESRVST